MPISQLASVKASDEASKTFVFEGEGHTLGNVLRTIIAGFSDVEFCGYTVPHPMEKTMNFRIQMHRGRAVDALKRGLEELVQASDHILNEFEKERLDFEMKELST